jgi:hypothetical protein
MKKPTKIGNIVLEYLNRNTKYDEIPSGYYSKQHILKVTGYSPRQFVNFMHKAKANDMVELRWFKVAKGSRSPRMPYYKLHHTIMKLMGLASR